MTAIARHERFGDASGVRCSVVMLTYARDAILREVLAGLRDKLAGRRDYEVVLVDNNPDDVDRLAFLEGFAAGQYIRSGVNKGIVARNDGMDAARGDFIVSLDDDVFIETADFIDRFAALFDQEPRLGVINTRKLDADTLLMSPQVVPHTDKKTDVTRPFWTFRFVGGCVAFRTAMHRELGGYSPQFFWGGEEIEYGYRIIEAGWTIYYTPDVVALEHEHPGGRRDFVEVETERLTHKLITSYIHMPFPQVVASLVLFPPYHWMVRRGRVRPVAGVLGFLKWLARRDRLRRRPIGPAARRYIHACGGQIWR